MDIDTLAAELAHARQAGADTLLAERYSGMFAEPHPLARFAVHLSGELAKCGLTQPIYLANPGGSCLIEPLFLATWLLQRSVKLGSERDAIATFEQLVRTNKRRMRYVSVVKGVHILEPIKISDNITLYPENFLDKTERYRSGRLQPQMPVHHGAQGCIVIYEFEQNGVILTAEMVERQEQNLYAQITGNIQSLVSLAPLVSGSGAIAVVNWFEFHDEESIPVRSTDFSYPLDISFPFSGDLVLAEPLKEAFARYQKLLPEIRDHIAVPLDRLNRSRRSGASLDSAIDLGIALESLLMGKTSNNSEITFKMSMRAAAFLGRSAEERKEIFNVVSDVYGLRSTAVHTGRLSTKKELKSKLTTTDAIRRGQAICAAIIRQWMQRNGKIDWDALLFANQ